MRIKLTLPKDQGLIEEALSVARIVTATDAGIQSDWGSAELGNPETVLSLLRGEFQGRRAFVEAMDVEKATAWVVSRFVIVDGHTRWQIYGFETAESVPQIKRRLRIKKEVRVLESIARHPAECGLAPILARKRL